MIVKDKKSFGKRNFILLLCVAILIIGGISVLYFYKKNDKNSQKPVATVPNTEQKINYDPPTETDKNAVDANKENIAKNSESSSGSSTTPSSSKKSVTPTITYAGVYDPNIEVGSYVNGVFEDGGKCTATFTSGSSSFTKNVDAIKNVSNMSCPVFQLPKTQFTTGTWTVKVSYSSQTSSGESAPKTFEVKQ